VDEGLDVDAIVVAGQQEEQEEEEEEQVRVASADLRLCTAEEVIGISVVRGAATDGLSFDSARRAAEALRLLSTEGAHSIGPPSLFECTDETASDTVSAADGSEPC